MAAQGQAIVTIGIKPTEPATGYGYIHTGAGTADAARREEDQDDFLQGGAVRGEAEF